MLLCISLNHRASSLPLLESASRHSERIAASFASFAPGSALLATCNRFELYLDAPEHPSEASAEFTDAALQQFAVIAELPLAELTAAAEVAVDGAAARHLFAVASGLESAALGEDEIAGQVRRAHTTARAANTVTDGLERLFQTATRTSRSIRERTGIHSAGRSLVRLALVLAERRVPAWSESSIVLIGTGAYAGATVAALRDRGAKDILVHSPSGRAVAFAASHDLTAIAPENLDRALAEADLVIACSTTQDPLLHAADFARSGHTAAARTQSSSMGSGETESEARPQLLLDLGMPRNIDPEVAELPGIELLDLDTIARHAPVPELSAESEARELVEAAAAEFATDQAERIIGPTLAGLRGHVLSILEDELCRAHGGASATPGGEVEAALRRFTGRLLHEPTTRLRALAREGKHAEAQAAANALFGVEA